MICPGGEMVYTLVLGTSAARRGGSSPLPGTTSEMKKIFLFLLFLILPNFAFARDTSALNDWYIKDFQSEIIVNKDSSLSITEKITADCGNLPNKHGIFRTLPTFYQKTSSEKISTPIELKSITDFSDKPINYSTTKSTVNRTLTWKIGDADKTVSGINFYKITYLVKNTIRFDDPSFDELYWNLSGNFWQIPIDHFTATIKFPSEINQNNTALNIYSGAFKEKNGLDISQNWVDGNTLQIETSDIIKPGSGITLSTTFPKNIITSFKFSFWELYGRFFWLLIPIFAFWIIYRYWAKYGKDPKINSAIAPEFEIPDKLSSLDMGMLYSNLALKTRYLSASIINLAVKKYITIEEIPKKGVFGSVDYKLTKLKEGDDKISESEKLLLDELFDSNESKLLSSLKNKFYSSIPMIQKKSKDFLVEKEYIDVRSGKYQIALIIFIFVAAFFSFILAFIGPIYIVSMILTIIIMIIFAILMSRRTEKGAMLEHRINGLKMYMEVAEKYRQKFNEKENIFEKFLPYAIMFGMTKKWIKQIEKIYGADYFNSYHPVWFYGAAIHSFNVDSLTSSIESLSSGMASTMSSSPSSSGSGGGGFSGGGGGGGGGGGW
jgi:uncharacterized membrane protein